MAVAVLYVCVTTCISITFIVYSNMGCNAIKHK